MSPGDGAVLRGGPAMAARLRDRGRRDDSCAEGAREADQRSQSYQRLTASCYVMF